MIWNQATPNSSIWTVDQLSYALNLDSDISANPLEAEYLADLQAAAVEYAETIMGCSLIERQVIAEFFEPYTPFSSGFIYGAQPSNSFRLPRGPIISITSVLDAKGEITNYSIEGEGSTDILKLNVGFTAPVTVVYQAGYAELDDYGQPIVTDIPADIRHAIRTHVATLHERRESATDRTITAVPHSLEAFYMSKARTVQVK